MAIRLLALDLDGTLLTPRGELTARNRAAVQAARAHGIYVTVVTGRRFRDARPLVLQLGLDDVPLISHNGALTKHVHTLETVSATLLPEAAARAVVNVGRDAGADALVSADQDAIQVKGGHGHGRGHMGRGGRGHHYGWSRGRHRGWR